MHMIKKGILIFFCLFLALILAARLLANPGKEPDVAIANPGISATPTLTPDETPDKGITSPSITEKPVTEKPTVSPDDSGTSAPESSADTNAKTPAPTPSDSVIAANVLIPSRQDIVERYSGIEPSQWGEAIDGVISRFDTDEKSLVLTLDACGWGTGSGYDEKLMEYLIDNHVPASLFISGKWIEDNMETFLYLAEQDNFEIENHGYRHKPLSVNGRAQYGITGTSSPGEVYDEIADNAARILELTGRLPQFFRTGTAFYDDTAVDIATDMGVRIAGFTIAGDAGATLSADAIVSLCRDPGAGTIYLFHMNHPESETAEGISRLVSSLRQSGYEFIFLSDAARDRA